MRRYLFAGITVLLSSIYSYSAETPHHTKNHHISNTKAQYVSFSVSPDSIGYSAQTSTTISRDRRTIKLIGAAKFHCANFNVEANEIVFDKISKVITVKDYEIFDKHCKLIGKGTSGEFRIDQPLI